MMFLMPIFWLLIIAGAIMVIISAAQGAGGATASQSSKTALDILKKRYARGEIGKEEYEDKRESLK